MISSVLAVALLCALVVPLPAQEADSLSFAGSVYAALPQPARFEAAATDELSVWKSRIKAVAANIPAYPADHYRSGGRGIVITTGRRTYFTAAVVTVRVIREHLKSSLPIELVYGGAAELPPAAVAYLSTTWPDIHMVDLTAVPELQGVSLQGYHIKVLAIYYSRFKEVLWLDSDDMPLADPASLFESKLYQQYGAVFWPDVCNMISVREETFGVFGQKAPKNFIQPREGKRTIWPAECRATIPHEIETGQILIDKERAWAGLFMTYFINLHHDFFLGRLFHGDKMTFHFGWAAVKQKYGLVPYHPASIGVSAKSDFFKGQRVFCGNTLAQKHPDKDEIAFLHRNSAKFKDVSQYFEDNKPAKKVWRHIATQGAKKSWNLVFRDELEPQFFAGNEPAAHSECLMPESPKVKPIPKDIAALEDTALAYLKDMKNLPFYPGNRMCNEENMFFCKTP